MQQRVDVGILGLGDYPDTLVGQALHQSGIFRRIGLEGAAVGKLAGHGAALDHHVANPPAVHFVDEIGIGDLSRGCMTCSGLEQVEQHHQ